jgi:RHS repeat-associated protein
LADGQISDEVFANGEITHRDYVDPRGLVTLIKTTLGGFPTQFLTYDYDLNGNLQTRGGFAAGPNETFTYDPLNRLTKVSRTDRSSTFTYDDLGNFLSRANKDGQNNPTSQLDYSFTAGATPHPDLVVSGTRYAFDGKGRNTMIGPSSAPQREVAYTPFDLPRQISVGGGAQQWLFHYDADHHRVQKIGDASNNSVTVGDWYEKNLDVEGLNHIFYVHGPERVVAQLKVDSSGHDQFFYLHDDHLGSVETMTDQGGFTNTFSYDAFGTRSPSQSLDLHKGFTFHSHDDDITAQADDPGLIDMKGRMYDPKIGRFTSADPFVAAPLLGQSYNRYAYVLNNPLKYLDPSGFQEEPPSFFGRVWRAITGGGSKSSAAPASNQSAPSGQQGGSSGADLENNQGFIIARAQAEGFRREAGKQTSANSPAGGTGSTSAPVQDGAGSHSTPMGGQGSGSGSPGPGNAPVGGPGTASPGGAGGVDPRGNAEGPGQGPTSGGGPGETGGGGPGGGGYSIPQGNWERRVLGNPARPDGYWGRVSNDWLAANRIVPGAMAPPFAAGYTGISGKIAQMLGLQTPLQVVGSLAGSMGEGALAIGGAAEAAGGGFFTVVGAGASGAGMGFTAAGGWTAVAGGVGVGAAGFVLSGLAWEGGLFVGSLGTGFLH